MDEVFGIPAGSLLVVLGAALAAAAVAIGVLALRNPILVRLGVRNVGRRGARTALIVVGLMLGTTIIAAALVTGDTMSHTIRSTAVRTLGHTDEVISARGAVDDIPGDLGAATGAAPFDESAVARIEKALRDTGLVDGVTGAIVEQVAVQSPATRRTEPSVVLFAPDPERMEGFGAIRSVTGEGDVHLGDLRANEVLLNEKAAEELAVGQGDVVVAYVGSRPVEVAVRDVVRFDGTGTADAAALATLGQAQELLGLRGKVRHVLVSNVGGSTSGARLSDEVEAAVASTVAPLGLEVETVKADAIETADETGSAFMAFFTTFGMFSIAAGILLIFLIFVMLATERRGELGIARAIGTRRGHLVQMFVFEGAAYDLIAAVVGAALGAAVAFGMVLVMAQAFGASDEDAGLQVEYAVTARSLVVAFGIGVLLTLAVVALSAWRVSVMTISAAIRNLPEPVHARGRRRLVAAGAGLLLGALMAVSGASSSTATPLMLGISLVLVCLVPLLMLAGVPERLAFTGCGLAIVVILLLPWRAWEAVFGQLSMDFGTWVASGLMIVVGTVWVIVYNADLALPALVRAASRVPRLAPIFKIAVAYPLAARFRTGATLAVFTLVVFTLVTGSASTQSFNAAMDDVDTFGGGFDVRAGTGGTAPIDDLRSAIRNARGLDPADFATVGSQSVLAVDARQTDAGRPPETYVARGLDDGFLTTTTFELGAIAPGYADSRAVWKAVRDTPGLAVVDSFIVPRRDSFGFAAGLPDFRLSGFVYEDGTLDPVPVEVTDPQTGRRVKVTVIGVLADTAPWEMIGLSTSIETLAAAFPGRARPTIHYVGVAPGVDADAAASDLEAAFLANGLEAESIQSVVDETMAANLTFNRLIQGFMGLGLVVGVAALGVISARAVVERRQQIGVLRALGFRRGMVQAAFLLESSVVALTAIVVGFALGIVLAYDIVDDQRRQPSWSDVTLVVPWTNLLIVFSVVWLTALAATYAPALRASRITAAEALRYE